MTRKSRLAVVEKPVPRPPVPVVRRMEFNHDFYKQRKEWETQTVTRAEVDFRNAAGRQIAFNMGVEPEGQRWLAPALLAACGAVLIVELARWVWG